MFLTVDNEKKVIFGWSLGSGSTHVKNLIHFLQRSQNRNYTDYLQLINNDKLPEDINNYTTILIVRNPFDRLVSVFKSIYKKIGQFRNKLSEPNIIPTFSAFVDKFIFKNFLNIKSPTSNIKDEDCDSSKLTWKDWKKKISKEKPEIKKINIPSILSEFDVFKITHQTGNDFDGKLLKSKSVKVYDINCIDYDEIEKIYQKKIPNPVRKFRYPGYQADEQLKDHIKRLKQHKFTPPFKCFDWDIEKCYHITEHMAFYNESLHTKVKTFYQCDFDFFNKYYIYYGENIPYFNLCLKYPICVTPMWIVDKNKIPSKNIYRHYYCDHINKIGFFTTPRSACTKSAKLFLDIIGIEKSVDETSCMGWHPGWQALRRDDPTVNIHWWKWAIFDKANMGKNNPDLKSENVFELKKKGYKFIKIIINPFRRAVSCFLILYHFPNLTFREFLKMYKKGGFRSFDHPDDKYNQNPYHNERQYVPGESDIVTHYIRVDKPDETMEITLADGNKYIIDPNKFRSFHDFSKKKGEVPITSFCGDVPLCELKNKHTKKIQVVL